MLFHSFEFLVLLTITLAIYYLFPKSKLYILAVGDLVFYGVSGIQYLILFLAASTIAYSCALKLKSPHGKMYYRFGILSLILNLAFFKYTGFILQNINFINNLQFSWQNTLLSQIVLPIGISFYTFQLIAYLVDVKNNKVAPCRSFIVFWVFVSFFGHLVAGPIMRGREFLPQIENISRNYLKAENISSGLYYICLGLIKKLAFADMLAPKVDYYFGQIANLNPLDAWFAAYLFAFQIYFDFSAYSDMAVGIGRLFGLRLDINFRTPYVSSNATEFWKRWHITLSSWIRDYIYIPLGGSRKGLLAQCLFITVAMAVSGLWHGAAWTFVIWGLYHGLLSVGHKLYTIGLKKVQPPFIKSPIYKFFTVFIFFNLITVGWVFFRAKTLGDAVTMLEKMSNLSQVSFNPDYILYFGFILFLYLLHLLEYYFTNNKLVIASYWVKYIPPYIRAAAYTMFLILLILVNKTQESTFIYFQF